METKKKDYSLLKPFNLKAAKRGDAICWHDGEKVEFIADGGSDRVGCFSSSEGNLFLYPEANFTYFRMAPLAWVEGKPVYKGDKLWAFEGLSKGKQVTIKEIYSENALVIESQFPRDIVLINSLAWNPPKVKKEVWINLYEACDEFNISYYTSHGFVSKEAADNAASEGRIDCVRIELKE